MNPTRFRLLAGALLALFFAAFVTATGAQSGPSREERTARLAKAEAMFQERCKTAGEKIHRTVDNVEGIFLMRLRPKEMNRDNQFAMDDPYGRDLDGDGYIETFVRGSYELMRPKDPRPGWPSRLGYRYVEAIDPKDGKRYRYTGRIDQPSLRDKRYGEWVREFVLDKALGTGAPLRYGVTYDDISTREDREYWIAGSSLRVIDLKTNDIIAERVGYMMDRGQGKDSGGRSPWLMAADHACPDFHRFPNPIVVVPGASAQPRQAQDFVEKVLKPILEK